MFVDFVSFTAMNKGNNKSPKERRMSAFYFKIKVFHTHGIYKNGKILVCVLPHMGDDHWPSKEYFGNYQMTTDERRCHLMIKLSLIKGKIIIMIKRSLIKGETGQEIIISAPHIKVGRVGCWGVRRQTLAANILIRFSKWWFSWVLIRTVGCKSSNLVWGFEWWC